MSRNTIPAPEDNTPDNASDNSENAPAEIPEEAVFVAYQDPSPVTQRHIDQIIGVTQTMSRDTPAPIQPSQLTDEEREEFEAFRKFREQKDTNKK